MKQNVETPATHLAAPLFRVFREIHMKNGGRRQMITFEHFTGEFVDFRLPASATYGAQ